MYSKIIFFLSAFLCLSITMEAQFYTGGNVSVNYNNGIYIDAAPVFGYRYKIFNSGVSPFYSYSEVNNSEGYSSYGGRIFEEITVFQNFFIHAELEAASVKIVNIVNDQTTTHRKWIWALPVGAGYNQQIAPKVTAYAMVLYDLLLDENSPKENPVVRAGIRYDL